MKKKIPAILSAIASLRRKIAFYPTLLALIGFSLAFLMIYFEAKGLSNYLRNNFPSIDIDSGGTALTILSVCITGLISMMVFSFSMVMVLLNQAASNYSPRLLPGLISEKNHQLILGIYLATILYCIFIAVSVQPEGEDYEVPSFSVLLGIFFTVFSLGSFVFFIHDISQNIQINTILTRIYIHGKNRLHFLLKHEDEDQKDFPDTSNWTLYSSETSGYFQHLDFAKLVKFCDKENIDLYILPLKGSFILKGVPLFRSSKPLDKQTVTAIRSSIIFAKGEVTEKNYALAFKQITEVIVKSMSPGINDPGTAINGIDHLTELFALRMLKKDYSVTTTKKENRIKLNTVKFHDLLYQVMASIRTYCKADIVLVQKLAGMLAYLKEQKFEDHNYYSAINSEGANLLAGAKTAITHSPDQKTLEKLAQKLDIRSGY